jgi:hypothetical protein
LQPGRAVQYGNNQGRQRACGKPNGGKSQSCSFQNTKRNERDQPDNTHIHKNPSQAIAYLGLSHGFIALVYHRREKKHREISAISRTYLNQSGQYLHELGILHHPFKESEPLRTHFWLRLPEK